MFNSSSPAEDNIQSLLKDKPPNYIKVVEEYNRAVVEYFETDQFPRAGNAYYRGDISAKKIEDPFKKVSARTLLNKTLSELLEKEEYYTGSAEACLEISTDYLRAIKVTNSKTENIYNLDNFAKYFLKTLQFYSYSKQNYDLLSKNFKKLEEKNLYNDYFFNFVQVPQLGFINPDNIETIVQLFKKHEAQFEKISKKEKYRIAWRKALSCYKLFIASLYVKKEKDAVIQGYVAIFDSLKKKIQENDTKPVIIVPM